MFGLLFVWMVFPFFLTEPPPSHRDQGIPADAPARFRVTSTEETEARATWEPIQEPQGVLVGYTIVARPEQGAGDRTPLLSFDLYPFRVDVPANATTALIGGLTEGTSYEFRAAARTNAGHGVATESQFSSTPAAATQDPTAVYSAIGAAVVAVVVIIIVVVVMAVRTRRMVKKSRENDPVGCLALVWRSHTSKPSRDDREKCLLYPRV